MNDKLDNFFLQNDDEERPSHPNDLIFAEEFELQEFMEWFPIMDQNFKMNPILWKLYAMYHERLNSVQN